MLRIQGVTIMFMHDEPVELLVDTDLGGYRMPDLRVPLDQGDELFEELKNLGARMAKATADYIRSRLDDGGDS